MNKKLLIAGGGTGGHIFPGIAIAEEWKKRGGSVVFVGTERGQEKNIVPKYGFDLLFLKIGQLKGKSFFKKIKTILGLPFAFFSALKILLKEKPQAVIGIGGYASGPTCIAAKFVGKYTAITDQNVQPGFTNRVLGKFVKRIFLSFDESLAFFSKRKSLVVGNPVRTQIQCKAYTGPKDEFEIFVFGGSQGAVSLNECFLLSLEEISDLWPKLKITHQAGKMDLEKVQQFYKDRKIKAEVSSFFNNIQDYYDKAHLAICRAGAGTLTELAMSGRPAILVPYPFAADNHQKLNAEIFANHEAAWLIEQKNLRPKELSEQLHYLYKHPEELEVRAANMKKLARPDAVAKIVTDLMNQGISS